MGHAFGTSKRFFVKKNFDEIDAAGFNDFSKRNFDEIDNAGFKDYLHKRNFDEIDAAGFNDFSKRVVEVINEGHVKGGDVKKNFDEIDAAGFNDLSKRDDIKTLLYAIRRKLQNDLAPYIEEYKKGNFDKDTPILSGLDREKFLKYLTQRLAEKYHVYDDAMNKREKWSDTTSNQPGQNGGKYDVPPIYLPYYNGRYGYPPYYPRQYSPYYGKPTTNYPFYTFNYPPYNPFNYDGKHGDNYRPPPLDMDKHQHIDRVVKYMKNKYGKNGSVPDNSIPPLTYY